MLDIQRVVTNTKKALQANSPQVFTGLGIVGVITTAYLTGRASFKAARLIDEDESRGGVSDDWKIRTKERGKLVWKLYVPPVASGMATIGCIYGVSRITSRRATAAAAAYALAERGFEEYKDKVEETIGKSKSEKVRDAVAQDKVDANPPTGTYDLDTGFVRCCELLTGRYFPCSREMLKRAENEINQKILSEPYVTLTEFYRMVGLEETSQSDYIGWDVHRGEMYIRITSTLSNGDTPVMAFDYSYTKPLD